jgi:transcriptional regulator with XRE-family HTH domain
LGPGDEKWLRIRRDALPFCQGVPITLKSLRPKDYLETPQSLGQLLKKRRRELGLLQREAAKRMGILTETYGNWETDKTEPVAARFRPVMEFLGYDPTPEARTLAERLEARRRDLGVTFDQIAGYLGWDPASLTRYLNGTWRIPASRMMVLELLLSAKTTDLTDIHRLPRRLRRSACSA